MTACAILSAITAALCFMAIRGERARVRAIVREEMDAERVRRSGLTGAEADSYANVIQTEREARHG
jgi:hypothetical protein